MVRVFAWNTLLLIASTSLQRVMADTSTNVAGPVVDLGYAKYQGHTDTTTNITHFLSIRYAAPPVGNLRFQAPQEPDYDPRVQDATQNPPSCYQTGYGASMTGLGLQHGYDKRQDEAPPYYSEDCLFLNVFVPGTTSVEPVISGGVPVLVWIHGGGYAIGNAAGNNGADLVADSLNSVVVVVIQYRLGAFGFLAGNEVKAHGTLNAGLLDQNLALKWVQKYIGLFGGDKTHVTIWGISAGAGSVLQHIVAHGGNTQPPLFNAAITSSTFLPSQYQYNHRVPQLVYDKVASSTGCGSRADSFTCLQSASVDALQKSSLAVAQSGFFGTFIFVPVVDGTFIVERPTVTLDKGKVNGQVLLAVNNQNEGRFFVNLNQTLTISEYISLLFPDMTDSQVKEATNIYRGSGTALEQAILVMGDSIFICPTYYPLKVFDNCAWKGLFAVPPANHGDDWHYYFADPGEVPPYNNTQFITAFKQSFMSFAKSYDVNVKFDPDNITPFWNKYNIQATEMLFNRTEAGAPVVKAIETDPAVLQRCAFWATMTAVTAQ